MPSKSEDASGDLTSALTGEASATQEMHSSQTGRDNIEESGCVYPLTSTLYKTSSRDRLTARKTFSMVMYVFSRNVNSDFTSLCFSDFSIDHLAVL